MRTDIELGPLVVDLDEVGRTDVGLVGGKAANLGELLRMEEISVPAGFCVTTDAFRRAMAEAAPVDGLLDRLTAVAPDDRASIEAISADVRAAIIATSVPDEVSAAIVDALQRLGDGTVCAVRSSATAEDAATASFAGQHDSFLGVAGADAVVDHVRRCWASLFTDRAVTYRLRNGIDHRSVHMAVIVQELVDAEAAGVLFTADPLTSHRRVVSVEATHGLGDALVAGTVTPDVYRVRDGQVTATTTTAEPVLSDRQLLRLADIGRRIEAHAGCPQDIEWCLLDDAFVIVQSRPITTLFPIPATGDDEPHVFVSVGHQQMMTDAMTPLGLSMWQLTAIRPMFATGGRLFVDVAAALAAPPSRAAILGMLGRSDPLIRDALETIVERGDLLPPTAGPPTAGPPAGGAPPAGPLGAAATIETDPAIVTELVRRTEDSLAVLQRDLPGHRGPAVFDAILADLGVFKPLLTDPLSMAALMAALEATWWLNEHLEAWLGEKNVADALTQAAPGNVTSEMGLALLDVADAIRPFPEVVAFLRTADDGFLDELPRFEGGTIARDAIDAYLDRYGMRCVGEIDITRPRWNEQPTTLLPVLLADIDRFTPGEAARRVEHGHRVYEETQRDVLRRVRILPDGEEKAAETERMIDRLRTFAGYREFPKYGFIRRYGLYKQALLAEVDRLVGAGVLQQRDDAFFLTFAELQEVSRTEGADHELIARRREEFRSFRALTPPRVLTSDGEVVRGAYRRDDVPPGALVGLAVSAGVVEGRARVILDLAAADLAPGDILVTTHTDPSWSPLFVAVGGLVTEVGGLMTHGAVVAREYGLPAVVGVEDATTLIRDGQRIRVDGTNGYVELLDPASPDGAPGRASGTGHVGSASS